MSRTTWSRLVVLSILTFTLLACGTPKPVEPPKTSLGFSPLRPLFPRADGRSEASFQASSNQFMVVTEDRYASEAAATVIEKGGNAIDALVTASFVLSVTRPHSTGIGGGGFLLYRPVSDDKVLFYDSRERAPLNMGALPQNEIARIRKPGAYIGVPGLVAGLWEVFKKHGSGNIPWSELVKPSTDLAAKGFPVYPQLEQAIAFAAKRGLLDRSEDARAFLSQSYGEPLKTGNLYINSPLARTLNDIAVRGPKAFYKGEFARGMAKEARKHGAYLSGRDLNAYKVHRQKLNPLRFRDLSIYSPSLPSSGQVFLAQMFGMIENLGGGELSTHMLAELQSLAFEDRAKHLGDPKFSKINTSRLTSPKYLARRASSLSEFKTRIAPELHDVLPIPTSTTHISIVDKQGNIVSSTQSINHYFGSGVFYKGVFLNNTLDDFSNPDIPNQFGLLGSKENSPAPGKTPLSSMSPTIVLKENQPHLVLGSPGGPRILSAVFQTIWNRAVLEESLFEAITKPRFHQQWQPNRLIVEDGRFPSAKLKRLENKGHQISESKFPVGSVSAIEITPKGTLVGVADPRRDGLPVGGR